MKALLWLIFWSAVIIMAIFTPKYLVAQKPGKSKTSLKYKMICSSMFLIVGACSALIAENSTAYALFMLIGLTLSWIGDFLLHVRDNKKFFLFGLTAFFSSHILYLVAYQNASRQIFDTDFLSPIQLLFVGIILLFTLIYCFVEKINIKNLLFLPVITYVFILSTMLIKACQIGILHIQAGAPFWEGAVLIVGSIFFLLSDATLGILMFNKKRKSFPLKIFNMVTYFSGQLMLASSVLFFKTQELS